GVVLANSKAGRGSRTACGAACNTALSCSSPRSPRHRARHPAVGASARTGSPQANGSIATVRANEHLGPYMGSRGQGCDGSPPGLRERDRTTIYSYKATVLQFL